MIHPLTLRDVLVPVDGGVVRSTHVARVIVRWEIRQLQIGVGQRGDYVSRYRVVLDKNNNNTIATTVDISFSK